MRHKSTRGVSYGPISLLAAVALWLSYGELAQRWPALNISQGLGTDILFRAAESDPLFAESAWTQFVPGLRWVAIDGDTVDVPGQGRVRLLGIDTPEMSGACAREREMARRAKARNQELLNSGARSLYPSGERDRYGRILADIRVGSVDIGSALLREGLARPYSGGPRRAWC